MNINIAGYYYLHGMNGKYEYEQKKAAGSDHARASTLRQWNSEKKIKIPTMWFVMKFKQINMYITLNRFVQSFDEMFLSDIIA